MCSLIALWTHFSKCHWRSVFLKVVSNQIKSNHFYCHITTAQVPWWVKFLRACSRQCKKKQQKIFFYIWTVRIYRLYRRQCAKYTYIYSVHIVYYKDILSLLCTWCFGINVSVMLSCLQITTLNKFMFYLLFNLCFAVFNNSEYRSVYIYIALMRLGYWSVGVSVWSYLVLQLVVIYTCKENGLNKCNIYLFFSQILLLHCIHQFWIIILININ